MAQLRGHGMITESNTADAMREVRRALLEADVHFKVAKDFVARVAEKALDERVHKSIKPGQLYVQMIRDELAELLGGDARPLEFKAGRGRVPVIMLVGLQGSGKTTTAGKLARYLKLNLHKKPLLVGADLQRPAAVEQLRKLAGDLDAAFYSDASATPVKVAKAAQREASRRGCDAIILDTAGRLHSDAELMKEVRAIKAEANPSEILFVADGMTGQDAVNSALEFGEVLDLTGVILTKMDGDARGGAAVSIRVVTGAPIKFMSVGEQLEDLEVFHPDRLANRILGMGDVLSMVERVQETISEKDAVDLEKKIRKESFTLEDMRDQMRQLQNMGGLKKIASLMPGQMPQTDEKQLVWTEAIINSMTVMERRKPEIINGSRRKRIARGSGRPVQEVNKVLKSFFQMKKMMKQLKKGGLRGLRRKLPAGLPGYN